MVVSIFPILSKFGYMRHFKTNFNVLIQLGMPDIFDKVQLHKVTPRAGESIYHLTVFP